MDVILSGNITRTPCEKKPTRKIGNTTGYRYMDFSIGDKNFGKMLIPEVIEQAIDETSNDTYSVITKMTPDGFGMILSMKKKDGTVIKAEGFNAFEVLNPLWLIVSVVVALIVFPPGIYYSFVYYSPEPVGFSGSLVALLYAERWFFVTSQLGSGRKSFE